MIERKQLDMTIAGLHRHYRSGDFTPQELLETLLAQCREDDNPIWITLLQMDQLAPYLSNLEDKGPDELPLYGIPFAIKDNIDLAGVPTTAACPSFSHIPQKSAFVVEQLIQAGAIPLGKTNMDQFATGLVGTRSPEPWGPCQNALNPEYISGGSSSGSAVAASRQLVSFSLGTDTAGSGRVPAAFNNIVGLKPSRGLLSNTGVVPACKSLDVISIFAVTAADANSVLDCAAVFDSDDAYSRANSFDNGKRYFSTPSVPLRIGVPNLEQLEFFGDSDSEHSFSRALDTIKAAGHQLISIDFEPFLKAARLLYEGPWVAERYLAIREIIEQSPGALLPVIREIIGAGNRQQATDAFSAMYQLQDFCQQARSTLDDVDMILTPTAGTCYRTEDVLAEPIKLNSNLGYYTNFMNLMDFSALAIPTGFLPSGVGFGVTLFHHAFTDKQLLGAGASLQQLFDLPLGASRQLSKTQADSNSRAATDSIEVIVCGAHLSGQPLNWQLSERGGKLLEKTTSSASYLLYALADGYRPGMVRASGAGVAIAVEVWVIPKHNFGSFVAEIPVPLGIGQVELADGRWRCGFICDNYGLEGATDISAHGGWLAYLADKAR